MKFKKIFVITLSLFFSFSVFAEDLKIDNKDVNISFFSGLFDKSHDDKNSTLFGFQHQDENLKRNTFFGKFSPITGAFITADNSTYFYTGVQAEYKIGMLNFTPSFTPGYYDSGDGKDLGNTLEFKTEVQLSIELPKNSQFGLSYNHISNGNLGDKNPGANSYMFNFFKNF
tara:strand:- start:16 stop:528 length:513 start_codon:yes stop_codon:yes gene_type:complete